MNRTVEWLNANQNRRYPFVDDDPMVLDYTGQLPVDLVLDFQFSIQQSDVQGAAAQLAEIDVAPDRSALTFRFRVNSRYLVVEVPAAAVQPFTVDGTWVETGLIGNYTVCFGEGCAAFASSQAVGVHNASAQIDPALILTHQNCRVDSIGSPNGQQLQGVITVEPGYNCEPTTDGTVLRFQAGQGAGAGQYCGDPLYDVLSCQNAWLWFNGQHASQDGNIVLAGGSGVQITPDPDNNTIVIQGSIGLANQECG